MKVLINKVAVEESFILHTDIVVTRLIIYKSDNTAVFLQILPNEAKEVLANGLRRLASELE